MLLTQEENGAGGKGDTLPVQWFAEKDEAYLKMHMIPKIPSCGSSRRFEDFIAERKKLIRQQFASLLATPTKPAVATA